MAVATFFWPYTPDPAITVLGGGASLAISQKFLSDIRSFRGRGCWQKGATRSIARSRIDRSTSTISMGAGGRARPFFWFGGFLGWLRCVLYRGRPQINCALINYPPPPPQNRALKWPSQAGRIKKKKKSFKMYIAFLAHVKNLVKWFFLVSLYLGDATWTIHQRQFLCFWYFALKASATNAPGHGACV
jgi:hypothetical protein